MGAGSREPKEADVDSLFSDLEEQVPELKKQQDLAVTLRPAPTLGDEGSSGLRATGREAPVSSALAKAPAAADAVPAGVAEGEPEPPTLPPLLAEARRALDSVHGVVGYVVRDADGAIAPRGGVDARFADRLSYVARLAVLVGDELGLEGLRELQVVGPERRVATVLARDGSTLTVLASAEAPLDDLSGGRR
jgi:predicted regulator of Ras-like GTPase activity (Roadblock/LC7/MglB family)